MALYIMGSLLKFDIIMCASEIAAAAQDFTIPHAYLQRHQAEFPDVIQLGRHLDHAPGSRPQVIHTPRVYQSHHTRLLINDLYFTVKCFIGLIINPRLHLLQHLNCSIINIYGGISPSI